MIVTGGSMGIGAAAARMLAAEGAQVAILDTAAEEGEALASAVKGMFYGLDVADRDAVSAAVEQIAASHGGIDGLINNAGIGCGVPFAELTTADWEHILGVNVRGAFNCTQAVLDHMKGRAGANIVNVSSVAGRRLSYFAAANYSTSKAALLGFTRHCAFEFAGFGIRVNSVSPGPTVTPLVERAMTPETMAKTARTIPLGRLCTAEDVAHAILFLASEEAAMCTGTNIDVDGGFLIGPGTGDDYRGTMARRGIDFDDE